LVLVVQLDRASGSEPEDLRVQIPPGTLKIMKFQFSAGGVVYKKENNKVFILVAQHSGHHGWVFPKGLIGDHVEGEDKEATALREVKEETGADAKIIKTLNPITYWFVFEKEKIRKTVYYFLMEFIGGDTTKHDHEMEAVEWLQKEEVEKRLTYKSDQKVWQEAKELI
jgi:8-oxo-dGTP diphosphatase